MPSGGTLEMTATESEAATQLQKRVGLQAAKARVPAWVGGDAGPLWDSTHNICISQLVDIPPCRPQAAFADKVLPAVKTTEWVPLKKVNVDELRPLAKLTAWSCPGQHARSYACVQIVRVCVCVLRARASARCCVCIDLHKPER